MKKMMKLFWNIKSVQSIHPDKSVIQTIYDIVKAHGGELKVASKEGGARPDDPVGRGTEFIFSIPVETIYL
jgi:hypothetical protein